MKERLDRILTADGKQLSRLEELPWLVKDNVVTQAVYLSIVQKPDRCEVTATVSCYDQDSACLHVDREATLVRSFSTRQAALDRVGMKLLKEAMRVLTEAHEAGSKAVLA